MTCPEVCPALYFLLLHYIHMCFCILSVYVSLSYFSTGIAHRGVAQLEFCVFSFIVVTIRIVSAPIVRHSNESISDSYGKQQKRKTIIFFNFFFFYFKKTQRDERKIRSAGVRACLKIRLLFNVRNVL